MSLKQHLLIVTLIILAVFVGWQAMVYYNRMKAPLVAKQISLNKVEVIRASWGLNCNQKNKRLLTTKTQTAGNYAYDRGEESKIFENNVLGIVKKICEGKISCEIPNNKDKLNFDPSEHCYNKIMTVEYRCFHFDRLWTLTIPAHETGHIDCSLVQRPE